MEISKRNNPNEKILEELLKDFKGNRLSENKLFELLSDFPESDFCYFLLGHLQKSNNNFEESLKSYLRAEKINQNSAEIKFSIAQVLFDKGEIEMSLSAIKKCLELNPNDKNANIFHANIFITQKKFDKAISIFDYLYNENNFDKDIGDRYAKLLFDRGRNSEAIKIYENLEKKFQDDITIKINKAIIYKLMEDYDEALKLAYNALKVDPNSNIVKAFVLDILFYKKDFSNFNEFFNSEGNDTLACNNSIAAQCYNISKQTGNFFNLNLCQNPNDHIFTTHISEYNDNYKDFLKKIIAYVRKQTATWEPKDTATIQGLQTDNNLFLSDDPLMSSFSQFIIYSVNKYRQKFINSENQLFKNWPNDTNITGWSVFLSKDGYQNPHIHTSGWVSGCFYLQLDKYDKDNGSIYFTSSGYDYPVLDESKEIEKFIVKPKEGDLILFPSFLFHGTIPSRSDKERISIAFDLKHHIKN